MGNYLIIGGSSGIGEALVQSLLGDGNQVYTTFNKHPISVTDSNLKALQLDVTADDVAHKLSDLPEHFDGLAYCPGLIDLKPFNRITEQSIFDDLRIQVIGAVKVIQAMLPRLKKSKQGSVVLYSTVAVQRGFTFHSQVSISKGAIEGLTKSLSAEFAPSVRVNAIAPSITDTPLASRLLNTDAKKEMSKQRHPLREIGKVGDIAEMSKFLLTDKSSWITGQIIAVDGGVSSVQL